MTHASTTIQHDSRSSSIDPVVIRTAYRSINDPETSLAITIRSEWPSVAPTRASSITDEWAPQVEVSSTQADSVKFRALVREWKSCRTASSSISEITQHLAYQKIIGMGKRAVPLILKQLSLEGDEPAHWFRALHVITLEQPVSHADRGNTIKMARAWLEWGKRNGYEW